MIFARKAVVLAFAAVLGVTAAGAQQSIEKDMQKARTERDAKMMTNPVTTIYLKYATAPADSSQILAALHDLMQPDVRFHYDASQHSISMRGFPDDVTAATKLIGELDRPRRDYRLAFTVTEMEGAKKLDTQHITMTVAAGERMTLNKGSKISITTMTRGTADHPPEPQPSYLELGLSFDVNVRESGDGGVLIFKVEQSGVADDKPVAAGQNPTIHVGQLEGTTVLAAGRPVMLGSLDMPGSGTRMEVEVTMTLQ